MVWEAMTWQEKPQDCNYLGRKEWLHLQAGGKELERGRRGLLGCAAASASLGLVRHQKAGALGDAALLAVLRGVGWKQLRC